MHIAIVGAGINGLMTALELVEQNCSISIFDQQHAGQAASWAGGGILSPMYPWRYPQAVNDLAQYAKPMYQAWNKKLQPITGIDFEIHESGMLIFDAEDVDVGLNYATQHHEPLQHAALLSTETLQTINPRISKQFSQALHFPHLANVRNPRLLQSIITYLKQHPQVLWHEHCKIHHVSYHAQKIQYIQDQRATQYTADQYIFTTGAWSEQLGPQLSIDIPVHPVQGQMVLFKTPKDWLPTICMNKVMYLIPRQDGHIVCGSSMREVGFDTRPAAQIRKQILTACFEMVPELEKFPVQQEWAGLRPSSPQGIPYIGKIAQLDNAWSNFGHFRNGLCMAPASAKLLRQLILGQAPFVNPVAYSPQRLNG